MQEHRIYILTELLWLAGDDTAECLTVLTDHHGRFAVLLDVEIEWPPYAHDLRQCMSEAALYMRQFLDLKR